jgi:GNAT superfamily N-acetyltransferase
LTRGSPLKELSGVDSDRSGGVAIRSLSALEARAAAERLAGVLLDAVAGGASVSFMANFSRAQAIDYWSHIADDVDADRRVLLVAGEFDGTAQLVLDTPPNQPHRADLAKMLVHRRARRRGLARALFAAIEDEARRRGRTLLTFDTMTGGGAERLYLSLGAVKVGEIPGYALWPIGGAPGATSVFYKQL